MPEPLSRLPPSIRSGKTLELVDDRSPAAAAEAGAAVHPTFPDVRQDPGTEWCWAAVAVGVRQFYGGQPEEVCAFVSAMRPGNDCCGAPLSAPCVGPAPVEPGLQAIGHAAPGGGGAMSITDVQTQIGHNRPIVCVLAYAGGSHAVVITGWGVAAGKSGLIFQDPQQGAMGIDFATFVRGYPDGGWWAESHLTQ